MFRINFKSLQLISRLRFPRRVQRAMTAIEILVVAIALILLLVLVIPRFLNAHKSKLAADCYARRAIIDEAKQNWYGRDYSSPDESPDWDDLVPAYLDEKLACPSGAEYILGKTDEPCRCSSGLERHSGGQ